MTPDTIPTGTVPPSGGPVVSTPVLEGLPATGVNEELILMVLVAVILLFIGFVLHITSNKNREG